VESSRPRSWLIAEAVAALLPRTCDAQITEAAGQGWRPDDPEHYCSRCGASAGPGGYTDDGCAFCVGKPIAWDSTVRISAYLAPVDRWIVQMKFARDWSWCDWYGKQLARRIEPGDGDRIAVCPVPMHWRQRARRGFNQAELIARAIGAARGWPVVNLLKRSRYTPPQTTVAPSKRQTNVRGSVVASRIDPTGWDIWLIDDVKTTGSTLGLCARVLRRAGARRVRVAVAAVADPRRSDFRAV